MENQITYQKILELFQGNVKETDEVIDYYVSRKRLIPVKTKKYNGYQLNGIKMEDLKALKEHL